MNGVANGLRRDVRGTAMTEFVIVLPIFVVIFAGIVELGKYAVVTIESRGEAKVETLDKYLEAQTGGSSRPRGVGRADRGGDRSHLHPKTASKTALEQLDRHPPHGERGRVANELIEAYERQTYLGLLDGHLGEARARVGFLGRVDHFNAVGVSEVVPAPRQRLFGRNSSRLVLAGDLVEDGFAAMPGGGECKSLVNRFTGRLNDALTTSGVRPMLAAGIRYGTVTGRYPPESGESVNFAGKSFRPDVYWNTSVGPRLDTDLPNRQTALAVLVSRLTLQSCHREPYVELPGIGRGGTSGGVGGFGRGEEVNRQLPEVTSEWKLEVPDPYDSGPYEPAGFRAPFRYRGAFMSTDYGE